MYVDRETNNLYSGSLFLRVSVKGTGFKYGAGDISGNCSYAFQARHFLPSCLFPSFPPSPNPPRQWKSHEDVVPPARKRSKNLPSVTPDGIFPTSPEPITIATARNTLPATVKDPSPAPSQDKSSNEALDSDYTTPAATLRKPQFHVVIAHHSEEPYYFITWTDNLRSIPYVQELGVKVIIHTKA